MGTPKREFESIGKPLPGVRKYLISRDVALIQAERD